MRKEYSDPFDNILYNISDYISEPLNNLNITPNMVTLLSIATNKIAFDLLEKKQNKLACLIILFTYFLDNLDGFLARKYKKISKIGDYLDHGSDIIFGISILYQLYKQNQWNVFQTKFAIYLFFAFLMTMHIGCQEKIKNDNGSPSIAWTKILCKSKSWIKYTRFFGPGMFIIIICSLFLW